MVIVSPCSIAGTEITTPAKHPHHQAAFKAQIDRLIADVVRDHTRPHSGSEDNGADQRHLDALRKHPFFAHQHSLEPSEAGQKAGQRRGYRQLHQQND
jgi:hypothetical protein